MIFKLARKAIGKAILLADRATTPKSVQRHPDKQLELDNITKTLTLYELHASPYCVKVRREIKRQALNIKRTNVKKDNLSKQTLISEGGKFQVPCLRIEEKNYVSWLYESDEIIKYLNKLCE